MSQEAPAARPRPPLLCYCQHSARRLERLGVLGVVESGELDPGSLLAAAGRMLRQPAPAPDLDLDGQTATARLMAELLGEQAAVPGVVGAA